VDSAKAGGWGRMDSGVDGNRPGLCAAEALRSPVISMGNVDSAHDTVTRVT
jgi:hypothetical protein